MALAALLVYYSATHGDNAVVVTPESVASLDASYVFVSNNLAVVPANTTRPDGNVPLNFYAHPTTHHHMTTASTAGNAYATAHGFVLQRVEGWVEPVGGGKHWGETERPLAMWYGAARDDHFLVGTAQHAADAQEAGYVLEYIDCYVPSPPPEWTAWPNAPPAGAPVPPSSDLIGFSYSATGMAVPPGIAADTWFPAWTASGDLVSSWTDGTVAGVRSSSAGAGATTGFATVVGDDPFALFVADVGVFAEPATPYGGRYPSLSCSVGGVWYYGTYALEDYGAWPTPAPDCGNWCIQVRAGSVVRRGSSMRAQGRAGVVRAWRGLWLSPLHTPWRGATPSRPIPPHPRAHAPRRRTRACPSSHPPPLPNPASPLPSSTSPPRAR